MIRRYFALAAVALLSLAAAPAEATHGGTVRVTSDADFLAAHWTGSGTSDDPYRLVPTSIAAREGAGIEIVGTQKHVNLSGIVVSGGGSTSDGLRLFNVRNVTVWGATFEGNRYGVHVRDSSGVVIAGTTVKTSAIGVYLEGSRGVALRANVLSLNDRNVAFRAATGNALTGNDLATATGQFGLFFEDDRSYDNAIDTSNVVNAAPIRWYTGAANVTLSDIAVDLAGITNVAQVMVHNASDVRLERVVAKSGTASGVVVHRSARVTLAQPIAENNQQSGILIELSNGTRVTGASVRNNTQSGLLARATNDTVVDALRAAGNLREGARAEASGNFSLHRAQLASNAAVFDGSRDLVVSESTFDGPAASGISLARSSGRFDANTIVQRNVAVSFTSSVGSNFTGNAITLSTAGTGFSFDSPASYDNAIAPTNLVNGTPVRWYTNVTGPLTLADLAVETRGITNVAQIMVYRSTGVTLLSPVARNGTAAGVVAYLSSGTNVSGANASQNGGAGVLVELSDRVRVERSTMRGNLGEGVRLKGTVGAVVENNVVNASRARGIFVEGGSGPALRGNVVTDSAGPGIGLDRVGPDGAAVENNALERNAGGIVAAGARMGTIRGNVLVGNGADGIALSQVPSGTRVESNQLSDHTRNVRLAASNGTVLASNVINASAAQWGFHFDDEASYNVSLATSNTVNGVPVRWYVGVAGPVNLSGARAEVRGITNVAQVMLYRSSNVTLDDAVAANGTARGIYVLQSDNVTVQRSRAEGNAAAGAAIERSSATRVADSALLRNRGGITVDAASTRPHLARNALADNGDGIALAAAPNATLVGNSLVNHTRAFVLDGARAVNATENVVERSADQTAWHFQQAASYANDIGPSNRVNGVGMRWYWDRSNVTLSAFRADVRGMTNVGQVGLIALDNVSIEDALAANGTAHGFFVEGGKSVRLLRSNATDNAQAGVRATATQAGELRNLTLERNGVGASLAATRALVLDNLTARGSSAEGILDAGSVALTVQRARVERAGDGIRVKEATAPHLLDNVVEDVRGAGIWLDKLGADARVSSNRVANASQGIRLTQTQLAQLHANAVTISGNQTAFHFDDETSYNVILPTTNTANGAPVHWYTTLVGTEAQALTLANVRSEVRGVTNVAQVMLYRSSYVALPDVVATNGTARGVYLYRSSSTALDGANASRNAGPAVELHATQSSAVRDLAAFDSGAGVRLSASLSNLVARVNASGSATGVHVLPDSRDNRVEGVEVVAGARGVKDDGWNGATTVGNNLLADAGPARRVKVGSALTLGDVVATFRHDSSRIVEQRWSWGDGTNDTAETGVALLKPTHTFVAPGLHRVELAVRTADGATLRDATWVEVVTPLSNPRNLFAYPAERRVTLEWSAPESDGASPITGYKVYRGPNLSALTLVGTVPGLNHTDNAVENGVTYTYAVSAVNADGEGPRSIAVAMPVGVPGAPRALTATSLPGAAKLAWEPPATFNGLPLSGYVVLRSSHSSALVPVATLANVTSFIDGSLTNGVAYRYAVRAYNSAGEGPFTTNVTVTPAGPPAAPRGVRAVPADAAIILVWTPAGDTGGSTVTGFRLWRGVGDAPLAPMAVAIPPNATSYRDAGLSNGERYTYAIAAVNAVGVGAQSATVNATPTAVDALAPVLYGHAPARGDLLVASPAEIAVSYADNAGVLFADVRLYVDGALVGAAADALGVRYAVPAPLALGEHTARVVARDPSGNEADETWTFRILDPSEIVPRFVQEGHALAPDLAAPGENVTARVSVRNDGYATGALVLVVSEGNVTLAQRSIELAPGERAELAIPFHAPGIGVHEILVGDTPLLLTVANAALPAIEAPTPPPPDELAPPNATEEPAPEIRRPARSVPPPREEANETPLAALLVVAALGATAFFRRRP